LELPVGAELQKIDVGCLTDQLGGAHTTGCPDDPGLVVSVAAAKAVGSAPGRLRTSFEVAPETVREVLLKQLARELPETDGKVLLLGLDGLDWDLILPWLRAGTMPNLDRLMKSGSWGVMETIVPTLSPLIWTSIATGVTPDRHGILDFVERDPARGVMVPVTGRSRRVPAIWNIASALGRTVSVVGWWGSWPADRVNGLMVSDRLYYTLTQGLTKEVLREDPPEMIFPKERQEEFVELRNRAVAETDWAAVRYFMNIEEQAFDVAVAADRGMEDPVDGFRRLLAATRTYLGAGLLQADGKPDLAMVYLEGTDTIGHLLAPYVPPPTLEVDPLVAARYVAAVPKYFQIVDRWIGRYLEQYPLEEYAVVVVSDHGFKWQEGRPRGLSGTDGPTAALWHEPDAAFVVAGRGVRALGRVEAQASIYDVAPTLAALLGLPTDPAWKGKPLPGCQRPNLEPIDYLALVPPASYRPDTGDAVPVDPEFVSKLRALGYLGGSDASEVDSKPGVGSSPAPSPAAVGREELQSTRGELNNLAIIKIGEKKYTEAEDLLRRAIEQSPTYPSPH
jgi:predicted AlkP superfamily phosphohydrolase/phosphomutase